MGKFIEYTVLFIVVLLLQILIFNNIHIAGYATVNILTLFVILLPLEMDRWLVLLLSTLIGMSLDMFNGTPALNTITLTAVDYFRQGLIDLFIGVKDSVKRGVITARTVGYSRVAIFMTFTILLQNIIYFTFEIFSLSDFVFGIIKVVSATASSLFFVFLLHLPLYVRQD